MVYENLQQGSSVTVLPLLLFSIFKLYWDTGLKLWETGNNSLTTCLDTYLALSIYVPGDY